MTYPTDLHNIVNSLAIAKKKLANIEEEMLKIDPLQAEINELTARLAKVCTDANLPVEAINLLLAAR